MDDKKYIDKNGSAMIEVEGTVGNVVFRNEDNGYTVLNVICDEDSITVVGILPFVSVGETIRAVGNFKFHPNFGEQFAVSAFEHIMPNSPDAICKYLSSGIIKGIGKATAKKIVDKFGEMTLDIIRNSPDKLTQIQGINKEKAYKISAEFKSVSGIKELAVYLSKFSITAEESIKIWKKLGDNSQKLINENPYIICRNDIDISFEKADIIAMNLDKPMSDSYRIKYGILHVIKHNMLNGHTCIPQDKLVPLCSEYLEVQEELIYETLQELFEEEEINIFALNGMSFVATMELFSSEKFCSTRLKLMQQYPPKAIKDCIKEIEHIEKSQGIKYADLQIEAIKNAIEKGLLIMTGGPGTGKTTTIKGIISILEHNKERVFLAAPTGRAAKRMSELTDRDAKTVHRLLGVEFNNMGEQVFSKNEKNLLKCDTLILDEFSMIDVTLFNALLRALPLSSRLIMIGDVNQLPSIGAGNVLGDIIESKVIPIVELKEIFRQSRESLIVTNAHKVVNGEYPDLSVRDRNFFFMDRYEVQSIMDTIASLYIERLPKSYGYIPEKDIQILTAGRKGLLGSIHINEHIQNIVNPKSNLKPELKVNGYSLRKYDKVIQTRNNYGIPWKRNDGSTGEDVFNGDIGIITDVNKKEQELTVEFDDKVVVYSRENLSDLELAYAITIHKSQGSEFRVVLMPMYKTAKQLCYRNLLYTGITRAKELLVMVGNKAYVNAMVDNNRKAKRYTALSDFLKIEYDVTTSEF